MQTQAPSGKDTLVEAFGRLDTCSVSDAMDRLGIPAGCLGVGALVPGVKMIGRPTIRAVKHPMAIPMKTIPLLFTLLLGASTVMRFVGMRGG